MPPASNLYFVLTNTYLALIHQKFCDHPEVHCPGRHFPGPSVQASNAGVVPGFRRGGHTCRVAHVQGRLSCTPVSCVTTPQPLAQTHRLLGRQLKILDGPREAQSSPCLVFTDPWQPEDSLTGFKPEALPTSAGASREALQSHRTDRRYIVDPQTAQVQTTCIH